MAAEFFCSEMDNKIIFGQICKDKNEISQNHVLQ